MTSLYQFYDIIRQTVTTDLPEIKNKRRVKSACFDYFIKMYAQKRVCIDVKKAGL